MNRSAIIAILLFASVSLAPFGAHVVADDQPLYGYSVESSRAERQWEEKLRAIPSPDNLRSYMQRLSAHPHHVGSPYDKDNAEWIASKFKEFGLDTHIE
ncbi:MAG: folate hydrolase, partial [Candidatus Acidiferrales bacterium]